MKELAPHPSPQDIYLMKIANLLSERYADVEVLRGKSWIIFVYYITIDLPRIKEIQKFKKEIRVRRATIEKHTPSGAIPKVITNLLSK
jgi:hypothetical protein